MQVSEIIDQILRCEAEGTLNDCIDNHGKHYQSQWLADALRAARQLMEEVK